MLNTVKILIKKNLNLKLVIMSEYQNTKNLLLKNVLQIGQKKFFFSKIKNTVSWTYVISGLTGEPIVGGFYEKKNCKNLDQQEFRIGKATKRKDDKLHAKWKGYDNSFNSWIQKKDLL